VSHILYKYEEHYDDTGSELVNDNDEELEEHPDEEQASVEEQYVAEDTETEDDDRKPSAAKKSPDVIMIQSTLELVHLTATTSAIMTQFTSQLAHSTEYDDRKP
jgi:hypothetical protein